ncbi:cupin domain-containing protein [Sulfitobacter porphyrae]|uniref:Cupin domain-containing protein n=1 Tax=Sulfitobacter porphyrae TaxID=1246864 RepID=A0ABW2B9Z3_9RHOB|nr:cupin [Sulfitobacter porphyrae]
MSKPQAKAVPLVEDERVRVTRFEFEPGAETGWHTHEYDYVITAVTDCTLELEDPGGEVRQVTVKSGEAYRRDKGVKHNVVNGGASPMAFIEVELK